MVVSYHGTRSFFLFLIKSLYYSENFHTVVRKQEIEEYLRDFGCPVRLIPCTQSRYAYVNSE